MALPPSTLSRVCRSVADFVSEGLDAANLSIRVTLGTPAEAAPGEGETEHGVNLFFYRIEPWGFQAGGSPGEPGWIRLHCLVTAFGVLEDMVSGGENDLRLLGEVIRLFHENPVLGPIEAHGEAVRLEVILQPLGTDEINHLWSTQGDVAYRTSVAYEMGLAPVIPRERAVGSPLVGSIGFETRRREAPRARPFAGTTFVPVAAPVTVDTEAEGWAPHVCFVHDAACAYSLAFPVGSDALAAFGTPAVAVVGDPAAGVELRWEVWTADAGWSSAGGATAASPTTRVLDPESTADLVTTAVALPFTDRAGQAVLYAVRTYARAADGAATTVRSNPLLVTLHGGAA